SATDLAKSIGYAQEDLAKLPTGANLGLSCGNPTAIAGLREGEIVLDLGSGAGFDAFLAARQVGASGRVIGVDMTPEMIAQARRNAVVFQQETGLNNVEFRLGEIEHLPLADSAVDVIISNCVINLSPDKPQVWREAYRVLKPGGRLAISDLALLKPLPDEVKTSLEALVGCIAGAELISMIESTLMSCGFNDIKMASKPEYIKAMKDWNDPFYRKITETLPVGTNINDFVTSLDIYAKKPS
ncbi:MAG: arsenite methyltransferase, partial [Calditrichota bacterium]